MVLVAQHGAPREPHLVILREKFQALRAVMERKNCAFKSRMTGRGGGHQFSSVVQSGPTPCDPMDLSTTNSQSFLKLLSIEAGIRLQKS